MTAPRVESRVECSGQLHRLVWADGELSTPDHVDPDGERTLAALGGAGARCIEILDRWLRHADDLDVLLLASRGPVDPVVPFERTSGGSTGRSSGGTAAAQAGGAFASKLVVRAAGRPRAVARFALQSGGWTSFSAHPGRQHDPDTDELTHLQALGDGLPHCLVTTVITAWADRIERADDRVAAAAPALHAALCGRVAATDSGWLYAPELDVQVHLAPPGELPSCARRDDALHLALPFSWLRDVWAPGLATVAGRFTLDVHRPTPASCCAPSTARSARSAP
jgi:hypothetical protein